MATQDNPDRRPLLYGFAALLILVAAGFLFWPRGDRAEQPGMVLTPSPGDSQLATQLERPNEDTQSSPEDAESGTGTEVPPESIEAQPIAESGYVAQDESASAGKEEIDKSTKQSMPSAGRAYDANARAAQSGSATSSGGEPQAPKATDLNRPGPSGRYLIYMGSFSTRDNAQRRVTELQAKGIPAELSQSVASDGTSVYRVRVGYFEGHSRAKAYGEELKSRYQIDYWIAER